LSLTYLQSLQQGLVEAFQSNSRVYLLGEDVLDPYGGAFKVTKGLSTKFPGRVLTTPISESALIGIATGMAMRGMRPVVEVMFGDFITLCVDQILNHATKFSAMYGADVRVPLVIRTPMGGGRGYGPTHSQSLENLFLSVPHLVIVSPSLFHDPGALLRHAILETQDVVLFVEHKLLYSVSLASGDANGLTIETKLGPLGYNTVVIRNYKKAEPDVALITYGGLSYHLISLLEELAGEEIRVLACLPSCLKPVALDTIVECTREAKRAVIVEDCAGDFGWGAYIAARLYDELWRELRAPIKRVAALDTIVPAAKHLEELVLVSKSKIEAAILEVIA